MKIRTRISLLFTLITATILLVFASVIYYSAKKDQEIEFYKVLKKEALTKANLLFSTEVEAKTLQNIYHNNRKIINTAEVAIYDTEFNLLYHDAVEIDLVKETKSMISQIDQKGEITFYQDDWQVIGLRYNFDGEKYIITAAAYDQHGFSKLRSLFRNLIIAFIVSVLIIYIAGVFFSKRTFKPVLNMTEKADNISLNNLDLRLTDKGNKDELSELANTFNQMLDRLEKSFEAQKHFVSNISHEIRTPLAAIITELELSTNKDLTIKEYKSALKNTLIDAQRLAKLSNSLLDFAKASYDPSEISFKRNRIDELLLDAKKQTHDSNPKYKIDLHFKNDFSNENQVSVVGNEYLLKVAFVNLFENGCRYSKQKHCTVALSFKQGFIILEFIDEGIGIANADLKNIFTPFFRGSNKSFADGNGIGLSLTQKIIELHKGTIEVKSQKNKGTTFTIVLPHL